MSPVLLAFDTSTEVMAVALQWPGGRLMWNGPGGSRASADLLPRVRASMAEAGLAWHALDAIAFGRGPGAFTGLRTACAVAQGLALGAGKPVVPIDSLLIVAEDAWAGTRVSGRESPPSGAEVADGDVGVVMDARMGEVYAARYRRKPQVGDRAGQRPDLGGAFWEALDAPTLCQPAHLSDLWARRPDRLAGSGLHLTAWAHHETDRQTVDRAAALLRLAGQAWDQGLVVEAAQALPLYLRDKVALTSAERAAAREAAGLTSA